MDPSQIVLAEALSLSGLIGASGAYAGLVRRRQERRLELRAALDSQSAIDRVERAMLLGRIDHTFIKSAYLPHGRYPWAARRPRR